MIAKIKVTRVKDRKELERIKLSAKDYKFKPYYFLRQLRDSDIDKLFERELSRVIADDSNLVIAALRGDRCMGFAILEKQAWDSSFFGFTCYKIDHIYAQGPENIQLDTKIRLLESILSFCREKHARYLNARIDAHDNMGMHILGSAGFYLVASMLHFIYPTNCRRRHFKQMGDVRPYMAGDLGALRAIAKKSMRFDHFHSDFNFPKNKSDEIYGSLIENCCRGVLADKVFVAERKNRIAGYVACKIRQDINGIMPIRMGHIRHLAVLQPEGFGCGPGLQEEALNWFADKVDLVESATTIQNTPIIRISVKSNMDIAASYLRFAKWF